MSSAKPLPIKPYPAAIAPQLTSTTTSNSTGPITIRTSRHWVLPPRPKPGRKPNHYDSKRTSTPPQASPVVKKELSSVPIKKSATAPACLSKKQISASPAAAAAAPSKKPTKTALKKEIQHIRLENSKLKQELSQLVGDLQLLKQKCCTPVSAVSRKRHFLEDSTSAFLKFEEDDPVDQLPPLLVSNAKMKLTSSMSSCRTIPTDDEDILTMSSSTPNSLISSDLQHSTSSVSSASSLNLNPGHTHALSPTVHGKPQLKFLDDYEQMEFYDKYMRMDFNLAPQPPIDENHLAALDSIKEEETDLKLSNNDDILSFLDPKDSHADQTPFFVVKQESPDHDSRFLLQENNNETGSATISNSTNSNFYMPPSLEELMEEQDNSVKQFPSNLTTNDFNYYEDLLKMEAFQMI